MCAYNWKKQHTYNTAWRLGNMLIPWSVGIGWGACQSWMTLHSLVSIKHHCHWTNHGKTIGKLWFHGIWWNLPSGKHLHTYEKIHHLLWENCSDMAIFNSYVKKTKGYSLVLNYSIAAESHSSIHSKRFIKCSFPELGETKVSFIPILPGHLSTY